MFSSKPNYLKLRTNLRLSINRLKLLEKKKTELALKARREIADYIQAGKDDRARIRVEHIIREDYLVEAMEIVEMLCDLLLARFGLIEKMAELDPGIEEAIATLIWVAPRLYGDIQEMREVAHQLTIKYGKEFAEMCRRNGFETVNEKVIHKMSLAAPPKILVEHYMIEIARTYKVPFEPDPLVMMGEPPQASNLIDLGIDALNPGIGSTPQPSQPSAAELKAKEAGQATGGYSQNQFSLPSVPGSTSGNPGMTMGSGSQPFAYNNAGINSSGGAYGAGGANGFNAYAGNASGSAGMGGDFGFGMPTSGSGGSAIGYGSAATGGFGVHGGGSYGGNPVGSASDSQCPPYDNIGSSTVGGFPGDNFSAGKDAGPSQGNLAGQPHGDRGTITGPGGTPMLPGAGSKTNTSGSSGADYSTALIGGVPVLPSEGQFPPPVPPGYLPPGGVLPSSSQPSQPPNTNQADNQMDGHGGARAPLNPQMSWINDDYLPSLPPYDQVVKSPDHYPTVPPRGGGSGGAAATGTTNIHFPDIPTLPDVPGLPSVPLNSVDNPGSNDDVDFDDLTRRFEELKKRK